MAAAELRETFEREGVVIIRGAVPREQVAQLRSSLEEVFSRTDVDVAGMRTDMNSAAQTARTDGKGDTVLVDQPEDGAPPGRFLTEIEAGRTHRGLREFEHHSTLPVVVGELLGTRQLRFFGDHCFLKEPGAGLHTAFHQDAPYFRWDGDMAAVCWVPVDPVTASSGGMRYVKGSHRWPQYAPRLLYSNEPIDPSASSYAPELPDNAELMATAEILSWDCQPGDVIIHHPNTVHGSGGNITVDKRRLAASIRYVGDDVRWHNKPTATAGLTNLLEQWHSARKVGPSQSGSVESNERSSLSSSSKPGMTSDDAASQLSPEQMYQYASVLAGVEMQDGDAFDARESARIAFPVVWEHTTHGESKQVATVDRTTARTRL